MKVPTSCWTAPWSWWAGILRVTHVLIRCGYRRQHCCMSQDKGEVTVRDLGSTNGIRINGQRVERGRLRPGDELSIARTSGFVWRTGRGTSRRSWNQTASWARRRRKRKTWRSRRLRKSRHRWRSCPRGIRLLCSGLAGKRVRGRRAQAAAQWSRRQVPDPGHRPDGRRRERAVGRAA